MAQRERGSRTRRLILEAAAEAFDEFGYDGASTTDILARCGLTRGGLYHHFPSKEAIAAAVVEAQSEALVVVPHPVNLQAAIHLTVTYTQRLQNDPVLRAGVRLTVEHSSFGSRDAAAYEAATGAMLGLLEQAGSQGELLPGVDIEEAAQFLVGTFTGIQLVSQVYNNRKDLLPRVSTMWRFVLPGLAQPGLLPRLDTDADEIAARNGVPN
ncbi:TetR/AcrR family transcriptional regulator [Streptomyces sp. LP05-1]|uniref:TetR/AcrR family transcriptional regulator n=1 Tax=Streptomyces pyxinae TaxID=2970734 RepID=A0ABT2CHL3_9ACTN|nr:ScbR family autoregulator-binding transcription factor [Streptomyces sp. LP05-1]MCS0636907.1 TetR/AcrR family transcriptional regulator [Streptomyces sp. LP05-1]